VLSQGSGYEIDGYDSVIPAQAGIQERTERVSAARTDSCLLEIDKRGACCPKRVCEIDSYNSVIPAKAGIQEPSTVKCYCVYILASKKNGTLYIGVTGALRRRVDQHKSSEVPGFTKRYGVNRLVHYEVFENVWDALNREKRLKKWNREWKIKLIEQDNPGWRDLYEDLIR
jgi:putative endonuclease